MNTLGYSEDEWRALQDAMEQLADMLSEIQAKKSRKKSLHNRQQRQKLSQSPASNMNCRDVRPAYGARPRLGRGPRDYPGSSGGDLGIRDPAPGAHRPIDSVLGTGGGAGSHCRPPAVLGLGNA